MLPILKKRIKPNFFVLYTNSIYQIPPVIKVKTMQIEDKSLANIIPK